MDRDIDVTRGTHKTADTDIENAQDFNPVETDHFEDLGHNNPTKLTALTREVDDLTNLTNSLIQDIPVFNGQDTTHIDNWLVDTESAADLTAESRTKLPKAKSKGLTHTLITEAIMSGKSWDNIKDLLCLKICNSDYPHFVSHFMEIQKKEKESLAAYIHWFKMEAKRCNFTNNAATIRTFVKGL